MPAPLNQELYDALERNFGSVRIVDPGVPMKAHYMELAEGRVTMLPVINGEYYAVNCPFCGDRRKRLTINHRWGVRDPKTGRPNLWLAHCFNENCLKDPINREDLRKMLSWYSRFATSGRVFIPAPNISRSPVAKLEPIPMPSNSTHLLIVAEDHPARKFLMDRHFDPRSIAMRWGVKSSSDESGCERLVIPVCRLEKRGNKDFAKIWGYVTRRILDTDSGPKYLTAKGFSKSQFLYGEEAVKPGSEPIMVCEGPLDVWRFQNNAVALLGKHASEAQVQRLCRIAAGRPIVVALDGDALPDSEKLVDKLRDERRTSILNPDDSPVAMIRLPDGRSPSDFPRTRLQELAWKALNALGCKSDLA